VRIGDTSLRERHPDIFTCSQESLQPHPGLLVDLLRLPVFRFGPLGCDAGALGGWVLAVSPERVPAREEILVEGTPSWALRGHGALKFFPRPESSVGAELALDLADRHCQVGLRIRLESFRDLEVLFCPSVPLFAAPASLLFQLQLAGVVVHCFLFHATLDPNQLSICRFRAAHPHGKLGPSKDRYYSAHP
jgi:hypothetical protein